MRALAVAAAILASGCGPAPLEGTKAEAEQSQATLPGLDPELEAAIDTIFADIGGPNRPGYAVGVVRGGTLEYAKGFGGANLDYGIPITASSVFDVASLSKQFTAAAVALLIVKGELGLEDEVRQHIAEFPARFGRVRVEHLVYMTSGLPEYYRLPRPGGRDWHLDYFTVEDAMAAVFAQPTLDFEPGTKWAYSNTNYQLLAEIVERVTETPFGEFLRRSFFEPLEMHDTHVNDELGRIVPRRVTGYNALDDGGYRQEVRRAPHYGGSGLFTTVHDLAKWDRASSEDRIGGPELTKLVLSTRRFAHDKANDAFGLVWGAHDGHRTLWYEGGDLGFSSYMVRLPDDDLSVIVLSNLGTGRAAERGRQVLEVLLEATAPLGAPDTPSRTDR